MSDIKESELVEFAKIQEYAIPTRGIGKQTCAFFDAGVNLTDNKIVLTYKDTKGREVAQKVRTEDRKWFVKGMAKNMPLYGQWLWEPNAKLDIVITEGELDALSVAETQGCKWPVVSVPNGSAGAKAAIQRNLQWLQGFKRVTLAFDNDEAGKKAVDECVNLFEPGMVRIADWGTVKDANEALTSEGSSYVQQVLFRARTHRPDKIVTVGDIRERILSPTAVGPSWPWESMTRLTRGVRTKELTVLMGPASVGKTTLSLECVHHMAFKHDMKCGIMSFEQSPDETYQVLCGMQLHKNLLDPAVPWEKDEIMAALDKLDGRVLHAMTFRPGRSMTLRCG